MVVRSPSFQQCGLGLNPGLFIFCSLMSSLLVLVLGRKGSSLQSGFHSSIKSNIHDPDASFLCWVCGGIRCSRIGLVFRVRTHGRLQ